MKLSPTQLAMLCIIDEATVWNNGEVTRYWIPNERDVGYTAPDGSKARFYVFGAGVGASLKALDSRGLTRRPRSNSGDQHARYITEAGRVLIEEIRSYRRWPNRID